MDPDSISILATYIAVQIAVRRCAKVEGVEGHKFTTPPEYTVDKSGGG